MEVAILGTGAMGAGMARSLRRCGMDVKAWNRTKAKALPLEEEGIVVAKSVTDAVATADVVITIVFDTQAVLGIVEELVGALGEDAVWLQCSTVGPQGIAEIAAAAAAAAAGSVAMLDMPVVGTKEPAQQGTLTVLASGDPAHLDRVRPVLDAIGSKTIWAGDSIGAASALKLVVNAWVATITLAAAQSLSLASALGVEGSLFFDVIKGTASDSQYAHLKGSAMMSGDYTPSFALDGLLKDIELMRSAAAGTDFSAAFLDAVAGTYRRASQAGYGDGDIAAVRTAFGA